MEADVAELSQLSIIAILRPKKLTVKKVHKVLRHRAERTFKLLRLAIICVLELMLEQS